MVAVDWSLIASAISFYKTMGFSYVEVPWIVPEKYNLVTCPSADFLVNSTVGSHVGSAEQGFIYLDHIGKIPKGKYVGCTPCFRREPILDDLHQFGFMKVELYQTDDVSTDSLNKMITRAIHLFDGALHERNQRGSKVHTEETVHGFDIMLGDIELGSYGIRNFEDLSWIYGTGIAEPRFSTALRKHAFLPV
jgi:hypothetical protein